MRTAPLKRAQSLWVPKQGRRRWRGGSEVPPQPVVPDGVRDLVEAPQAGTTVEIPAPTAGDTGVQPTAPGALGGPQGVPSSQKKAVPRASRKQRAVPVALAPLKAVKRGAQSTPGSARPKTPPPLNREEGELPHVEEGREAGQRTPDPPTEEGRTPRPQEAEETVVASEAVPPTGDVSQGGHDHQAERGLTEGTLGVVAVERPHGKAPARPEAPAREGGGRMVWGQDPMIWPNPDDPEGRARFVLDDPSESYL
ncbi:basic salivary proline-rich protein 3-like [Sorghum bicolor]|uniref:basic salivary proline-rich protein 3-like n=1 Tax=Sorghum bicolor TaxID=4558 RepID=UPI000B4244D6|nr:basic salivary proline-rich protein 3-like [Sorghum bicolor]|eukprot:XP_021303813.1 basic salivary proline-rich protein 3-like [Sorghum bicolor]